MLSGNRFQIALRNVTAPEETIETACKQLVEKGFLNYYGLQRFGTRIGVPTYQIGLKLLLGQYQEAIELILDGREGQEEAEKEGELVFEQSKKKQRKNENLYLSRARRSGERRRISICAGQEEAEKEGELVFEQGKKKQRKKEN
ncbi:hypothetical protein ACJJTC_002568 [Scirpophaga incertulas]